MTHPREAILQRLQQIAGTLVAKEYRNEIQLPDTRVDTIVLLDADELADDKDPPGRSTLSPRRVTMQPQLLISMVKSPQGVGTSLNQMQARLIHAVLSDAALLALSLNGCGVRYVGSQTALAWGRTLFGEMAVQFAITYLLRPDQLSEDITA